ncbi:hypothetical protein [Paenibacillus sp. S150]|uniref:hypothetical protein n=1 Tax=Paenibacillus sp. S150 TaxID=2749826 RepID=UPI001C595454|nr:hypothetical protein [Paenibacillus sp. S150]MBW4085107.1 hypothetical protein [Paenibacillus sp. S150]
MIGRELQYPFPVWLMILPVAQPVKLLNNAALKSPKEEWGISPREEEVLELIILSKPIRK